MTTSERLAKVAEVLGEHGGWESASGGFRCYCGTVAYRVEAHLAESLRSLLDEFAAQDKAAAWAEGRQATWHALGAPFIWFAPENPYEQDGA